MKFEFKIKNADNEFEKGKKTESEYKDTILKIIKMVQSKLKSEDEIVTEAAEMIAKDHLKEMPDYYSKLAKMEGKE